MPSQVTLVVVDTEAYVLANNAIERCVRVFAFDEVLVFSDRVEYWPHYHAVRIEKIRSIDDYNNIVLSVVPPYLKTDFFVIAQFDGFALNAKAFSPEFYNFDYIGAVWPHFSYFTVGNGGFSWRSTRLAKAVATMAGFRQAGEPEDVFIARIARVALETRHGCVFAGEEVANRFSIESGLPQGATFGFHGLMYLPVLYQDSLGFLLDNLPSRVIRERLGLLAYYVKSLDDAKQSEFWAHVGKRSGMSDAPSPALD